MDREEKVHSVLYQWRHTIHSIATIARNHNLTSIEVRGILRGAGYNV